MRSATAPVTFSRTARVPAPRLNVVVVHELVDAIVRGTVIPGNQLPPAPILQKDFGVSMTVIRESIKRLEEKGLVVAQQGRGVMVRPVTDWDLLDPDVLAAFVAHDEKLGILDEIAEMRVGLESEMAASAARHATAEDLAAVRAQADSQRDLLGDIPRFYEADRQFHEAVMTASKNRLSSTVVRRVIDQANDSVRFTGRTTEQTLRDTIDEHSAIADAIERGDPEQARQLMREHLEIAWQRRRLSPPAR